MGLFSSKYVHHVGTSVQRMVPEDQISDPYVLSLIDSVMNGIDLVDNLLETGINSLPVKVGTYLRYVENNHPQKMPSGQLLLDTRYSSAVKAVIDPQYVGTVVQYKYTHFGPANAFHEAWDLLINQVGYDTQTGVLNGLAAERTQCVLTSMLIELPVSMKATLDPWTVANWASQVMYGSTVYFQAFTQVVPMFPGLGVTYSATATGPSLIYRYNKRVERDPNIVITNWEHENGTYPPPYEITQHSGSIPLVRYGDGKTYYQSYFKTGSQDQFWVYEFGTGGYPTLDALLEQELPTSTIGLYYPNIYYRLNKTATTDTAYVTMSRRLGQNFGDMQDNIHANADIGDVESALFGFGFSADSTNPKEQSYIFDYFKQLYQASSGGDWSLSSYLSNWTYDYSSSNRKNRQAIHIKDDVFKYALTFEKITVVTNAGTLGAVGFVSSGVAEESRTTMEWKMVEVGEETSWQEVPVESMLKYRWYKKQVSVSFWEEVRVYDLAMVYWVFENYTTTLGDDGLGNATQELCLIPLDKSLIDRYSFKEQHELYLRSFSLVFNSHVVQKIRWYQSGFFRALVMVVAFVYAVWTFDWNTFAVIAELAGAWAVIQILAYKFLVSLVVSYAFKLFVKEVGMEAAFVAAIAAVVLGFYGESIASITPDQLLELSGYLYKGIQAAASDFINDLSTEFKQFISTKTELEKELEAANDLLKTNITPIAPVILGESPDQFLYRTTVFGSSGFTQLNAVDSYVDRAMYLPTTGSQFGLL